jgi:hypothetical protein
VALRRLALLSLAALAVAGWAGSASQAATGTGNVATTRICTGCADQSDLGRYGYVTLHAWDYWRIPEIRAENPDAKILVYKDMASTPAYDCHAGLDDPFLPSGLGYCWTLQNHPDWFTTDPRGNRLEWENWPGNWQMDVGSAGYQNQWAANVLAGLREQGWDGVVVDDANVDERPQLGSRTMSEYPTQPSYQAATRSFLANVGPKLTRAGFLVIPNIQSDPVIADAKLWADWTQFTSGGTREYWMKWGTGTGGQFGGSGWADLMEVMETVQREGKIFLPTTSAPAGDVRSMRWGRASFLMGWNGGPSAFTFAPTGPVDPWSADWTTDIGTPAGAATTGGNGVWRRDYTGGVALVNTSTGSQPMELGSSYLTPEGMPVTQVALRPLSGLVLHFAPGAAPPAKDALRAAPNGVSLLADDVVHGRVLVRKGTWKVGVYWRARGQWHIFGRVETDTAGKFVIDKRIAPRRTIHLRAVARQYELLAHSPVVRVSAS